MEIRSFLAFELPEDIKAIVSRVSAEMKGSPLDIRWVKIDNIHLTVIFLGKISTEHAVDIGTIAGDVCNDFEPFSISLKGTGIFSSKRNPRVLWIGLDSDMKRMSHFKDTLQKNLKPFGIKAGKRKFNPHLALGRFRKGAKSSVNLDALLQKHKDLTSPVCSLRELALFKSDLKPGGAIYTKLNTWPLGSLRVEQ